MTEGTYAILYSPKQDCFHVEMLERTWKLNMEQLFSEEGIENTYRLIALADSWDDAVDISNTIEEKLKEPKTKRT